jgi:hypothetical protein
MLINRKAVKALVAENGVQVSKDFFTALDLKVNVLVLRSIKRANGHRLTPMTLQEIGIEKGRF